MPMFTVPVSTLPVSGLRRELDRLFDEGIARREPTTFLPPVDLREDVESYLLELDMPGVTTESVEVLAEEGVLTIKGERRATELREGQRILSTERAQGAFSRRFRLPKQADSTQIEARYVDGVLSVRVAKIVPAQPRRVEVKLS
jgi:HSP20 family protein